MAAISQLKRSELYKLAVESGFDSSKPEEETNRKDLIDWLRENSSVVDESKVNRRPRTQTDNPTITNDGRKIKINNDLFAELDQLPVISHLIESVMERAAELWKKPHPVSIEKFCEIAGLIIAACDSPDMLTLDVITRYRTAGLRVKFFTISHRAVLAVLRDQERQYGSCVACGIIGTIVGLAITGDDKDQREERKKLQEALIAEVRVVKGLGENGNKSKTESENDGSGESSGSGESDDGPPPNGEENEISTPSGEGGGDQV